MWASLSPCSASLPEDLPTPDVTWSGDDSEVSNGSHASVGVAGELVLPGAWPQDASEYVWRAGHMAGLREQASPTHLCVCTGCDRTQIIFSYSMF